MKKLLLIAITALTLQSCTENMRARKQGGDQTINLSSKERLVNLTWKEDNLWILTKEDTTIPTIYTFKEKSNFGVLQGTITIVEK